MVQGRLRSEIRGRGLTRWPRLPTTGERGRQLGGSSATCRREWREGWEWRRIGMWGSLVDNGGSRGLRLLLLLELLKLGLLGANHLQESVHLSFLFLLELLMQFSQ